MHLARIQRKKGNCNTTVFIHEQLIFPSDGNALVQTEIRKVTCSNCKIILCSTNENDNTKLFSRYLELRHKKLLKYFLD